MIFKNGLDTLILAALRDGPMHGYAIAKAIRAKSGDALKFGEGQLYPTLHRLEKGQLVEATWEPQDNKPPRKVYTITDAGLAELDSQMSAWARFAEGFGNVLRPRKGKRAATQTEKGYEHA